MLTLAVLVGAKWGSRRSLRLPRILCVSGFGPEALVIIALSFMAPAVSAVCTREAFLAQKAQIRQTEQTNKAYFLPRVSLADAATILAERKAVFVDARYAADYGAGHIPGAINIPVTASAETVRLYLANVPHDFPIIVYCQSRSCPFSKTVAVALGTQGFSAIKLLEGGWREWSTWKP